MLFFMEQPGLSDEQSATWKQLGALTVDMIKDAAPKNAPIDTTHGEFKSWDTPVGSYTGQWAEERADGICRLMKEDGILVEG